MMSDDCGCDAGHDCSGAYAVGGGGDTESSAMRVPHPGMKVLTLNGAPIIESSHEYVLAAKPKRIDG